MATATTTQERLTALPEWVQARGLSYFASLARVYRGEIPARRIASRWYVVEISEPSEDE